MVDHNKSARLVICQNCGIHAYIGFRDGQETREFLATEAISFIIELTRTRQLSFAECGRFMVQLDDWMMGLNEAQWQTLKLLESGDPTAMAFMELLGPDAFVEMMNHAERGAFWN